MSIWGGITGGLLGFVVLGPIGALVGSVIGSNLSYLSGGTLTPLVTSNTLHRNMFNRHGPVTVSYTHLTLPTNREV